MADANGRLALAEELFGSIDAHESTIVGRRRALGWELPMEETPIDVTIEKLVYGGDGLARPGGRAMFVPYVLPGERVAVREEGSTKRLRRGVVDTWHERVAGRIDPKCPLFTACGGCHYQHIPADEQVRLKAEILRETMARLGKIEWSGEIGLHHADPWGYRNRSQFHIHHRSRGTRIGFREARSHRVVEATNCPIQSPALNRSLACFAELAAERQIPKAVKQIEVFGNETDLMVTMEATAAFDRKAVDSLVAERLEGYRGEAAIDYRVGEDAFDVAPHAFFQVNRFLVEELQQVAVGDASGGVAMDLYAGVGLFSVPMARRFEKVLGVESSFSAIRCLSVNSRRAGVEVLGVESGVLPFLQAQTEAVDFVLADPPRAGIGEGVARELVRLGPERIALVACDPATLARDLRVLVGGGYSIEALELFDLFPQTYHMEAVVRLRRA